MLAAHLVHGDRRRHYATARVRQVQPLQQALQCTIFTARTVQGDPDAVESRRDELGHRLRRRIPAVRVNAASLQRSENRRARFERDLALARTPAVHDRNTTEIGGVRDDMSLLPERAHAATSPTILTS